MQNNTPDFVKMAEDALGITRKQSSEYRDSGSYYDMIRLQQQVPQIAAALGIAYGMGLSASQNTGITRV